MTSVNENAKAPEDGKVLGLILFSMGLYAMVLGLTVPLALLSWPGSGSNDASLEFLLLTVVLLVSSSLLNLASLLTLKVHWLPVLGVLLLAFIVPYIASKLLPAGSAFTTMGNELLAYVVIVLVLSLILASRVKGIWPALWRTLLVSGVSAAIVYAVAYIYGQVAASGSGAINGQPPSVNPIYPIFILVMGCLDILIIFFWLTRKRTEASLSHE